jgi:putative transposase
MDSFSEALLRVLTETGSVVHAWCLLPNHYHALVQCEQLKKVFNELGRLHGRTSFLWNAEENSRGRKIFYRASDRTIRSERHFWATMNYIHHNPVHHGYVKRWTEWPWSSAENYFATVGRERAEKIWREYPLHDFGAKWDSADS